MVVRSIRRCIDWVCYAYGGGTCVYIYIYAHTYRGACREALVYVEIAVRCVEGGLTPALRDIGGAVVHTTKRVPAHKIEQRSCHAAIYVLWGVVCIEIAKHAACCRRGMLAYTESHCFFEFELFCYSLRVLHSQPFIVPKRI